MPQSLNIPPYLNVPGANQNVICIDLEQIDPYYKCLSIPAIHNHWLYLAATGIDSYSFFATIALLVRDGVLQSSSKNISSSTPNISDSSPGAST